MYLSNHITLGQGMQFIVLEPNLALWAFLLAIGLKIYAWEVLFALNWPDLTQQVKLQTVIGRNGC